MSELAKLLEASCVFVREPYTVKAAKGTVVYFREWSGADTEWWMEETAKRFPENGPSKYDGLRAAMIVRTVVDEAGVPVWTVADAPGLAAKLTEVVIDELYQAARLFHKTDDDGAEKKT